MSKQNNIFDVAIIGSGPAGMQATLVLAQTRKKIVVFDDLRLPRNAASHGVHNFLGLDGSGIDPPMAPGATVVDSILRRSPASSVGRS